jgi:hypothetical protein
MRRPRVALSASAAVDGNKYYALLLVVSNVLVKRGKKWHGPGRMIVNARSIVFVSRWAPIPEWPS